MIIMIYIYDRLDTLEIYILLYFYCSRRPCAILTAVFSWLAKNYTPPRGRQTRALWELKVLKESFSPSTVHLTRSGRQSRNLAGECLLNEVFTLSTFPAAAVSHVVLLENVFNAEVITLFFSPSSGHQTWNCARRLPRPTPSWSWRSCWPWQPCLVVALSQGVALEFLPLRRGLYTILTAALNQGVALQDGWMFWLSEVGHGPNRLVLDVLVDLYVLAF
jgi:hypothetical protein